MTVERPIYIIKIRAKPKIDAIRALRAALKALGRRYGLQVIAISREEQS
jgi:hypothetical protein